MASSSSSLHMILSLFLVTFISSSFAATVKPINGLHLPIVKDTKTLQYYTSINMGSTQALIKVAVDLGGQILWFGCDSYTSSTYKPVPCDTKECEIAKGIGCVGCSGAPRPGCTNNTCGASPYNPFQDVLVSEGFATDTLYSKNVGVPQMRFSCMGNDYLQGLAHGVTGMLGLAKNENSLHKQVVGKFNLPHKFAICLPSKTGEQGNLFVSGGAYTTRSLKTTPLITNPVSTAPAYTLGDASDEYFIDVKSISVQGKPLSVKSSYFSIDKKGVGGTKISTIANFTVLHNSIYKPFTRAFVKAASDMKIKTVAAVAPFRACFDSNSILGTQTGPSVPTIDLVLPGNDAYWRIYGANSMVQVGKNVMCLAFLDGGSNPRTSIVIGGHQLEDNLLEFDLNSSVLRFSSSLLEHGKSCSRL